MAGASTDFDAAEFNAAIAAAMEMGMPLAVADRPTFHWSTTRTWAAADAAGEPWDWAATPTTTTVRDPLRALCAVEVIEAGQIEETIGSFNVDRARLTFLEAEYAKVVDFDWVALGGNTYVYQRQLPPLGLFDAGVRVVLCVARDES